MKNMIRFAVRLYPVRWRARYGPEFDALLEDMNAGFGDLLNIVKEGLLMQFNRSDVPLTAVAFGFLGIFVAALVFLATPRRYASSVTIGIEDDRSPELAPVVAAVASHVFSDEALTRITEQNELYPSERRSRAMPYVLHRFREDITFRPTPEALHVSFTYPDSHQAQEVAADLAGRLIEENLVVAQHEAAGEGMRQQAPPRYRGSQPHLRFRVADAPHQVPVGANLIEVMSLGFGGGALAGFAIGMRRRRIQPSD